jgi:MYXO-CTERM domain-containing protein
VVGVIVVALFVIANVTAKNAAHPGTVSNVAFVMFIVGLVALIGMGVAALLRRRAAR